MNDPYYMHQTNAMKKRADEFSHPHFFLHFISCIAMHLFYLLHRYALILIAIDIIDLRSINARLLINN